MAKWCGAARITVAPDGKSRTVTINGTDANGKKFSGKAVHDKGLTGVTRVLRRAATHRYQKRRTSRCLRSANFTNVNNGVV